MHVQTGLDTQSTNREKNVREIEGRYKSNGSEGDQKLIWKGGKERDTAVSFETRLKYVFGMGGIKSRTTDQFENLQLKILTVGFQCKLC